MAMNYRMKQAAIKKLDPEDKKDKGRDEAKENKAVKKVPLKKGKNK